MLSDYEIARQAGRRPMAEQIELLADGTVIGAG